MSELERVSGDLLGPLDELAVTANREHAAARDSAHSMAAHAVAAGRALLEAKAQQGHGHWLPWVAANLDFTERHAQRYMLCAENATRVSDLDSPDLSLRAILKRVERVNREEAAEQRRLEGVAASTVVGSVEVRHGDLRHKFEDLRGQVDAIITDPPYPAEFIDEFDALGQVAAEILKPDGVLVAMVGQSHLPAYLGHLAEWLEYRWCGAYLTEGPATRVQGRSVGTKWKPLLVFDLGGERRFLTQDVFTSKADDKQHHDWGQSESGMADIVARFTEPGDLVVDPFFGAGTTGVVCEALGRRCIGCDTDANAVHTARERLAA